MSRVFILGAGFSRAVHEAMPVLSDLASMLTDRSEPATGRFPLYRFGNNVERWLSFLASPPPWLTAADVLRCRGDFEEASRMIAEHIEDCESVARTSPVPEWLDRIVRWWRTADSTVITFNYDILVELAYVHSVNIDARDDDKAKRWILDLYRVPVTPAQMRLGTVLGNEYRDSFALLKLHGSRNWYRPPDQTAGTVYDTAVFEHWNLRDPGRAGAGLAQRGVSDLAPMIVPPIATKSLYYTHTMIRSQWQAAADAIRDAIELVIIGYSLPATDLSVVDLLTANLTHRVPIEVVDINDTVADNIRQQIPDPDGDRAVTHVGGENPIETWLSKHTVEHTEPD